MKAGTTWLRWPWLPWVILGFVLFVLATLMVPRTFALYWYPGIKRLFYEDLNFSDAESTLFATILSFLYAAIWLPFLRWSYVGSGWRFRPRQFVLGLLAGITLYGLTPFLKTMYGADVCFNQSSGEALQWFVTEPGGVIVRYDSPGYDKAGVPKRPVTPQICHIIQLQKRGIRPHEITADLRQITFFDNISGQPLVWYFKSPDGRIEFFDAEGMHPMLGEPLLPITKAVVIEEQNRASAKQAEVEHAAKVKAAEEAVRAADAARAAQLVREHDEAQAKEAAKRAEAEAQDKARRELIDLFGVPGYADGAVILGAISRSKNDIGDQAARQFLNSVSANLRKNGILVDEFRPAVYSAGYVDRLLKGDTDILSEVGLRTKMRGALLAEILEATCTPTSEISGLVSCKLSIQIRLLTPAGNGTLHQLSEIGAGTSAAQAVSRAAELLVERHPDLSGGI
jgi:hypothetical protein